MFALRSTCVIHTVIRRECGQTLCRVRVRTVDPLAWWKVWCYECGGLGHRRRDHKEIKTKPKPRGQKQERDKIGDKKIEKEIAREEKKTEDKEKDKEDKIEIKKEDKKKEKMKKKKSDKKKIEIGIDTEREEIVKEKEKML